MLTLGINESQETAPYLSQRIGETSIEVVSKSESVVADRAKSFMSKQSTGVGKRAFLSPAEICELSRDGSVILFADHQPVYANKFPFTLHPDAAKMEDTLPAAVIDFSDKAARKTLRMAEAAYRKQFWESHQMQPNMDYRKLNGALFTEPPQDPVAMVLSMLRDDFFSIRKYGARLIQMATVKERAHSNRETEVPVVVIKEEKVNESAEKGAFQRFYDDYRHNSCQQPVHFYDLSIEIDDFSGEALFIQEQPAGNEDGESRPSWTMTKSGTQGLTPNEQIKKSDSADEAPPRRGRSLKNNTDWNAFSIPTKEMKESPETVKNGNLPKAKS